MKKTVFLCLLLAGCAAAPKATVIPKLGGEFSAIGQSADRDEALSVALDGAKKECQARGRSFVVVDQRTEYQGQVGEGVNNAVKLAANVASMAGQWLPTMEGDKDYKTTVIFRCE